MMPKAKYINGNCPHDSKSEIGGKEFSHIICLDCGSHWYGGREWAYKEWEEWINSTEEEEED